MPQTITVTIEKRHVQFIEEAAEAAEITVDQWVNNLIRLSRKAIPELCLLVGVTTQGVAHAKL